LSVHRIGLISSLVHNAGLDSAFWFLFITFQ